MRIAFVGTANSGKTTLVNEIDKQNIFKNHPVIKEVAGTFPIVERSRLATQMKIIDKQIEEEKKHTNFISDRSVIDNATYFLYHYKNSRAAGKAEIFKEYMGKFNEHMLTKPYDALVFIDEYFPLEDNGIRDMDEGMQSWVWENIESMCNVFCDVYKTPVYCITGSLQQRVDLIKIHLKKHYSQKRVSDFA